MTEAVSTKALNELRADAWYREDEIAVWSRRTLQDMRTKGDGPPYVKVRGAVLYRGGAILEWLRSREGK